MKSFTQLATLAVSVLLLSSLATASPTSNIEVREPIPAPGLVGNLQLSEPAQLEKRKKKPSSSNGNTTSDALSMAPDGTLRLAGVAILSSAMFLMA